MRWPETGTAPKVKLSEVPVGTLIDGMIPIGVRWSGVKTAKGVRPDAPCPAGEFSPCFALIEGEVKEIIDG